MSLTWKTEIAKSIHFELYKKEGLSELTQLNLNANQLRSSKIEGSALKDAKSLKKFEARNNKLSRLPALANTTESVDLSGFFLNLF